MTLEDEIIQRDSVLTLSGSPFKIGLRLGEIFSEDFLEQEILDERIYNGYPVSEWMRVGWDLTDRLLPDMALLVRGLAEGSGATLEQVFTSWYEELYDIPAKSDKGCSDVVAYGSCTRAGNLLMGHTNDCDAESKPRIFKIDGMGVQPTIFFSGNGPSVAVNDSGLVISGNQLEARDIRPGIPRMLLFLKSCFARTIPEALKTILHPMRASSYNYVFADESGRVVNVEASAAESVEMQSVDDYFVHTNHYVEMPEKEIRAGDPLTGSLRRREFAMNFCKKHHGKLDIEKMKRLLSWHSADGLGSICRHDDDVSTVFAVIYEPMLRQLHYTFGPACESPLKTLRY